VSLLGAGAPIEPPHLPVGRRSTLLVDPERDGRLLGVDLWYPAVDGSGAERSVYDLIPGASFSAATALHDPPARAGQYPLIVFSHGRTGMRFSYSMLCEALASRGAIVVSSDHPGDGLTDWMLGAHADDRTNEVNRVADAHLLIHALVHGHDAIGVDVLNAVDHDRIAIAGHSYGAYTALATVAGARGVPRHDRVGAAVVFQPYTRTMSDGLLGRVTTPTLMIVSELDGTTPAATDSDRPWALLRGEPTWRLDLAGAGHQAISDIALYAELAPHIEGLPDIVVQYLTLTAADAVGPGYRPWRDVLRVQLDATWAFLQVTLGLDPDEGGGWASLAETDVPGVVLRRR
jgi:predicted dienelactone hydrolase